VSGADPIIRFSHYRKAPLNQGPDTPLNPDPIRIELKGWIRIQIQVNPDPQPCIESNVIESDSVSGPKIFCRFPGAHALENGPLAQEDLSGVEKRLLS
jgi:hypothetical protein